MKRKVYHDHPSSQNAPNVSLWNDSWSLPSSLEVSTIVHDTEYHYLKDLLSPNDRILEAGCGNGKWLIDLSEQGYDIIGLDFSFVALQNIRNYKSLSDLTKGDVRSLPFKTGSFHKILSWGVLEHLLEGPEKAIKEHYRCLKEGGILFITIPRLSTSRLINPLVWSRRILSSSNLLRKMLGRKEKCFFQYEYTSKEFADHLKCGGFTIRKQCPVNSEYGILDDMKPVGRLCNKLIARLAKLNVLKIIMNWYFGSFTYYECWK